MRLSNLWVIGGLLVGLLGLSASLPAQDAIKNAQQFIQKSQYDNAIKELSQVKGEQADYAAWLTALAYSKSGNTAQAVAAGLAFKSKFPQSKWFHKVNFLVADSYLKQKNYQAAELVYSEESSRLLSEGRKKDNAEIYIKLAQSLSYKPRPEELDRPKPDFAAAYRYYKEALKLEIGGELAESVRFELARAMQNAGNLQQSAADYVEYLASYDPDWHPLSAGQATAPKPVKGAHIEEARLNLAEVYLKSGRLAESRVILEDLIALMKQAGQIPATAARVTRLALRRLPFTYQIPNPGSDFALDQGVKAIDDALKAFPDDSVAVSLAWFKVQALLSRGRTDQAIAALSDVYTKKNFRVPASESAAEKSAREDLGIMLSPEEQFSKYQKEALAQLGALYARQNKYALAIKTYSDYIAQFPNGPHWTAAQTGIVDAEYQMGVDKIREKQYAEAEKIWESFLANHPLDTRSARILFTLAQVRYQRGLDLKPTDKPASAAAFNEAITGFKKLVSKYPGIEESSLAQLAVGEIQERQLGDFESALKSYQQLTWGSKAGEAAYRVATMTGKELIVKTRRVFHTDEPAFVTVQVRNMEKLKISAYKINLESYFRKFHTIQGIENLDLALIQPDKTWDVAVKGYAKYLPIEQEIPLPASGPGVWAVSVSTDELESTTLVIQSDIDVLVKSSRKEILVFAQDMRKNQGAAGARILISDGRKVILESQADAGGTLLKALPELANGRVLQAFVEIGGNVAATGLDLTGLSVSSGLVPKGYIYTDKPAYNPGEPVHIKGILRDVVNGSYALPAGRNFSVSVIDPNGKSVLQKPLDLTAFGTVGADLVLSPQSAQGQYTVTVVDLDAGRHFSGTFQVQIFKLQKIRLNADFDRSVYFRGEKVKLTFAAEYYFGQAVSNHDIQYITPDGLTHAAKTNAEGNLMVEFDTTPYLPGQVLAFQGTLSGEQVSVNKTIALATQEFSLKVSAPQSVVIAGTPQEFSLRAQDAGGNFVSRDVEVSLVQRLTARIDPVLAAVPWLAESLSDTTLYTETTIEKVTVKTDAAGLARLRFSPKTGGDYLVRARATDRFATIVSAEYQFYVSDDSDATQLRLFTHAATYAVGNSGDLVLHSRFKAPTLAVVSVEGEGIIQYKVLNLNKPETVFPFLVGNEHFPNFTVNVAAMSQGKLHEASASFDVERQLTVTVKPLKAGFKPGEMGPVEINVKDHLGKPVSAEFSLALVNESLLRLFPATAPAIIPFFQDGVRRLAPMKSQASVGFAYTPATKAVNQDLRSEDKRLAQSAHQPSVNKPEELEKLDMSGLEDGVDMNEEIAGQLAKEEDDRPVTVPSAGAANGRSQMAEKSAAPPPRQELPGDGYWSGFAITDAAGKATLTIPMPQLTSSFAVQVKAVTKDSLVGESNAAVAIRREFFADLKTPAILQENDLVQFTGTIHNLTDYKGPVAAQLTILVDGVPSLLPAVNADIAAQGSVDLVFPAYKVPNALKIQARLDVKAANGSDLQQDSLLVNLATRPWGLPWTVRKTGTASDSATIFAELPADKKYSSLWMQVRIAPPTNESLVSQVLGSGADIDLSPLATPFVLGPEARLHALVALSDYLAGKTAAPGSFAAVGNQVLATIADLVASQHNDGSWSLPGQTEDIAITAQAYWSLVLATKAGFAVDPNAINNAKNFLKNRFTGLPQDENESKAIIQYALAFSGDADFSFINRLYRIRNELGEASLIFTALTLAIMEKPEVGRELLPLIAAKAQDAIIDSGAGAPQRVKYWAGSSNHAWLRNPAEATALALLAYQALKPQDPLVAQAVAYLQSLADSQGYSPAKAIGYATQALAQFYGQVKPAAADYSVQILVNDQVAGTVRAGAGLAKDPGIQGVQIPLAFLKPGKNKIQFAYSGRGEYRYFVDLSGFSTDMTDPKSWDYPNFTAKKFIHEPILYKGRAIGQSTMAIGQLEMAQTAEVEIAINGGYNKGYVVLEDYIPAGAVVLKDSLRGDYSSVIFDNAKLLFFFKPDQYISTIRYTIAAYSPGTYQVLPPVLRQVFSPAESRLGKVGSLRILAADQKSSEAYAMNPGELFGLGSANFQDGHYEAALELLEKLYKLDPKANQPNLAQMLLWMRTEPGFFDGQKVVAYFEVLKEKYPELSIPFAKIMMVGKAYHDIGEFERSYLIYRAVVDSSFLKDSGIAGNLERAGDGLGSFDFMARLWQEYNDSATVSSAWFSLAQSVYGAAPEAEKLSPKGKAKKLTPADLLDRAAAMLWSFASTYPDNELADDAAFSRLNIALDKKDYNQAIDLSRTYQKNYAASNFFSNFQYIEALAQFSLRQYQEAIRIAGKVAAGKSENRDLSTYILGQIYHAQRKPEDALAYYKAIQDKFPDAAEAIQYFESKAISMDEINLRSPGEKISLPIKYRNIKELNLQVYKVDLMKLYLRERNLSKITKVNLSGIAPLIEKTVILGIGKDYQNKESQVPLDLTKEGAYLVVCRGDELFSSGLVLISPLRIEVQEEIDAQRVRVNVYDAGQKLYPDGVHVKVVGSNTSQISSGETDLRGIFVADGISGITTVIAQDQANRYAFYRGAQWIGPLANQTNQTPMAAPKADFDTQYRGNDFKTQQQLKQSNRENLNRMYQEQVEGVQVQQVK